MVQFFFEVIKASVTILFRCIKKTNENGDTMFIPPKIQCFRQKKLSQVKNAWKN